MTTAVQTTNDPIARLGIGALVAGYFVLAIAVPAQASPSTPAADAGRTDFAPRISTQAQPTQPLPTVEQLQPTIQAEAQEQQPTVEPAQPAAGGEAPAPAPVAEQPAVVAEPIDEARPAEHPLPDKAQQPAPPQAVQPGDGAILLQANDEASFQNVLEGEGSKPATHRLP